MSVPSRTTSSSNLSQGSEASKKPKSKKIETHWLLNDFEFLGHICQQSKNLVDFPHLLFNCFEVNDKGADLLKWAIEKEIIETVDVNSVLSNDETIANRLVHHLFCSDLGTRYLSSTLLPFLKRIVSVCEANKSEDEIPSLEKDGQWIIELLRSFLESMETSVLECPILIRESFMRLHQALVAATTPNPYEITARAFFLYSISPAMKTPTHYSFFTEHKAIQSKTYKTFELASQIFDSLINGNVDGYSCEQSNLVKDSSLFASEKMNNFARLLTDEKAIKMSKTVISASSKSPTEDAKEEAVNALRLYLDNQDINQRIESEVNYMCKLDHLLDLFKSNDWKTTKTSKKNGIIAYSKKIEGSPILSFKTVARIEMDFDVAVAVLQDTPETYLLDPRITEAIVTKKTSDSNFEWMFVTRPTFPVAGREWVLSFHSCWLNENTFCTLNYSIPCDLPVRKGYVRGEMMLNGFIIEKCPQDSTFVVCSSLLHMDLKGNFPSWMVNRTSEENITAMKKVTCQMRLKSAHE